jgi:hypothetical protein
MLKHTTFLIIVWSFMIINAQFKSDLNDGAFRSDQVGQTPTLIGFLSNVKMNYAFESSYTTGGGNGFLMNSYKAGFMLPMSPNFLLTGEVGVMTMPYSTFDNNDFGNKLFFNAQMYYRLSKNAVVSAGVSMGPGYGLHSPFYSPYGYQRFFDNTNRFFINGD